LEKVLSERRTGWSSQGNEMTGNAKRKTLISLGLVMAIIMVLAASLPRLKLQAGMPLPRLENNQVAAAAAAAEPSVGIQVNQFFGVLFSLILTGLFVYGLYKLVRGAKWIIITGAILRVAVISLIVGILIWLILRLPNSGNFTSTTAPVAPTTEPQVTVPLEPVPPALLWLVGIGLLVIGILAGVWILTASSRRARPITLVGQEAEKARQALRSGMDLKDVIIRCYRQMSLALEKERGIERKEFMTTGEFEKLLEAAGIPHEPIHQLTHLFEAVRYGNWQPNPVDEDVAIRCLETIILFSREARATN
jgi:Domain of unknown function (DUF4129)